jgi:hypothetical protein
VGGWHGEAAPLPQPPSAAAVLLAVPVALQPGPTPGRPFLAPWTGCLVGHCAAGDAPGRPRRPPALAAPRCARADGPGWRLSWVLWSSVPAAAAVRRRLRVASAPVGLWWSWGCAGAAGVRARHGPCLGAGSVRLSGAWWQASWRHGGHCCCGQQRGRTGGGRLRRSAGCCSAGARGAAARDSGCSCCSSAAACW